MAEGWFRELADDRLEVFLKAKNRKVRAHGRRDEMFELVAWFEEKTGVAVKGEWKRPLSRGPRPYPGQESLDLTEVTEPVPDEPEPDDREVLT